MLAGSIRSQIRPFPTQTTYPTTWAGEQTFEEIMAYLSPLVVKKYRRFGMYGQDIPDALQNGFMHLWQELIEQPDLLAEQSKWEVMWHVVGKSKMHLNQYYNRKKVPWTDIGEDRGYEVDEYGLDEIKHHRNWWDAIEHRAGFTMRVDFRMDIEAAIHAIAEEYADDIKGLVALYILTTSVESHEALKAHDLAHSMVYERMTAIKHRLQRILKDYEPTRPRTWQERMEAGEFEPYLEVVEHYQDRPLALFALYTLTTDAKVRRFARDEKERKMISYYRKKCLKRIEAAYGQAASF